MTAFPIILILGSFQTAFAQFTFMGDYDKTFAAPLGYYVDPEDPVPTIDDFSTYFVGGALLPNGSIVTAGRHVDNTPRGAFYLRKFTPTGGTDAAFGLNGVARHVFYLGFGGTPTTAFPSNDTPQIVKVQPDGKILVAGQCNIHSPNDGVPWFGTDACVMRFNADGSADASFGNVQVFVGGGINSSGEQQPVSSFDVGGGRFINQTGEIFAPGAPPPKRGTNGVFLDMDIQPDGKIVLVGETRNEFYSGVNPIGFQSAAFVMRLNANGTRDGSFGNFGISQMAATPTIAPNCYPNTGFQGVRVQADGRIIAVGYTNTEVNNNCFHGKRFTVTRWTAGGQIETVRTIDNNTAFDGRRERATRAFFTGTVGKFIVSGSYNCEAVLVRFNVADLSVDTSFGTNGVRGYAPSCPADPSGFGSTLWIRAIQPDGKILGIDEGGPIPQGNVVRFNPDGTPDQSFGNQVMVGNGSGRGRLRVNVTNYNGSISPLGAADILVRPNGRINLVGYSPLNASIGQFRAAVSQQNTTFKNGVYSDFGNDGRSDLAVYRDGTWYWLNSANNSFNAAQFGVASDKLAPADYDGDGKTDLAVFRDGAWYIIQSSNDSFRALNFGTTGDLPRPGDFDGDGRADVSVFRPSDGTWYRINSATNQFVAVQFGAGGDTPLIADFDGDSRSDVAVFRAGVWYYIRSSDNQFVAAQFGIASDIPVVGDYDGDSRSDLAVFRPANGTWYIARPTGNPSQNFDARQFGASGDKPVPGDYDNDGKNDLAVYRGGAWYIIYSGNDSFTGINFGSANDKPVEAAYTQP